MEMLLGNNCLQKHRSQEKLMSRYFECVEAEIIFQIFAFSNIISQLHFYSLALHITFIYCNEHWKK